MLLLGSVCVFLTSVVVGASRLPYALRGTSPQSLGTRNFPQTNVGGQIVTSFPSDSIGDTITSNQGFFTQLGSGTADVNLGQTLTGFASQSSQDLGSINLGQSQISQIQQSDFQQDSSTIIDNQQISFDNVPGTRFAADASIASTFNTVDIQPQLVALSDTTRRRIPGTTFNDQQLQNLILTNVGRADEANAFSIRLPDIQRLTFTDTITVHNIFTNTVTSTSTIISRTTILQTVPTTVTQTVTENTAADDRVSLPEVTTTVVKESVVTDTLPFAQVVTVTTQVRSTIPTTVTALIPTTSLVTHTITNTLYRTTTVATYQTNVPAVTVTEYETVTTYKSAVPRPYQ